MKKTQKAQHPGNKVRKSEVDPLFVIFEEHLYNFQDSSEDRKSFLANVVLDYILFLRQKGIVVPSALERSIVDELGIQVNQMLLKKMYGCHSIEQFQDRQSNAERQAVRARYARLR